MFQRSMNESLFMPGCSLFGRLSPKSFLTETVSFSQQSRQRLRFKRVQRYVFLCKQGKGTMKNVEKIVFFIDYN